jgi:hypothetical protein
MWEQALIDLAKQVNAWANAIQLTAVASPPLPGEALLVMTRPSGERYMLEPAEFAGRKMPPVVWLYSYPTMRRVRLLRSDEGAWQVQSSDGVPFHQVLTEQSFAQLIEDLRVGAA